MERPTKDNTPHQGSAERLMALARKEGTLRGARAEEEGIPWVYLRRLLHQGRLEQIGRGLYRPAGATEPSSHHGLVLVALRSPQAVISLLSALAFHELTTQIPWEVWITLGPKAHKPKLDYPPVRLTHAGGSALTSGIEQHILEGVPVRIYSLAKTVADLFKYRNKVGLDVALEAVREYRRDRRGTVDDLVRFGRICRVWSVMRPYVEALYS